MKSERILGLFVIGLLLFLVAYTVSEMFYEKEGFTSARASDCNCLPGYIPSNKKGEQETSIFFCQKLGNPSDTKPCY